MILKVSSLLNHKITPFLFGVFLSRTIDTENDDKKFLTCYSKFKKSKYVYDIDFNFSAYVLQLKDDFNFYSGYSNWVIDKVTNSYASLSFSVLNDMNISTVDFIRTLYKKLMLETWIAEDCLNSQKKQFIRGFFESRGSVDTCRRYIAQDYYYNNLFELRRALQFSFLLNIPLSKMNINFRNLQPQYTAGEVQRNTQLRIESFWYAKNIGFINLYKATIFDNCFYTKSRYEKNRITYFDLDLPILRDNSSTFINYINFFTNYIYEKKLNPLNVGILREHLGFEYDDAIRPGRNQTLKKIFDEIEEDKCAICGRTETFINKSTGRQYFEIHHVISFANGIEFDNILNLVKLCPTCHDSLSKGYASKEVQIKNIIRILTNKPNVREYVSDYFQEKDIMVISEKIWEMLC